MGIYSIKKMASVKARGNEKSAGVGIRASYLRVVGIQVDTEGAGKDSSGFRFYAPKLWNSPSLNGEALCGF